MNILIIEDDIYVADFIKKILQRTCNSHIIDIASSFDEGFSKALSGIFDIILLDIDLGDKNLNGIALCKSIRQNNKITPLIIITAYHSLQYLEKAFEEGANDYITKPFRTKELSIRIKRWFSLSHKVEHQENIEYKDLSYDPDQNEFYYRGEKLPLTKKNKILLLLFLRNPEKILSPQYIREKFWGDYDPSLKRRNLRSNIQILRNSLPSSYSSAIHTVRGEGYMLQI